MIENTIIFLVGVGVIETTLDIAQSAWALAEPTVNQGIEAAKRLID